MASFGLYGSKGPARGFVWSEVDCNCGKCVLPVDRLSRVLIRKQAKYLNRLRAVIRIAEKTSKVSLRVNSWYRCAAYNKQIGGVSNSQHLSGIATDIQVFANGKRVNPARVGVLAARVAAFKRGGIGVYDANHGLFTHVDSRKNGPARWVNG